MIDLSVLQEINCFIFGLNAKDVIAPWCPRRFLSTVNILRFFLAQLTISGNRKINNDFRFNVSIHSTITVTDPSDRYLIEKILNFLKRHCQILRFRNVEYSRVDPSGQSHERSGFCSPKMPALSHRFFLSLYSG